MGILREVFPVVPGGTDADPLGGKSRNSIGLPPAPPIARRAEQIHNGATSNTPIALKKLQTIPSPPSGRELTRLQATVSGGLS